MESIWTKTAEAPKFEKLEGNLKTDILVIGGGIAGILCAYMLKREGVDCVLVEAKKICSGITENTTAKITLQHGLIYNKMIERFGENTARLYFEAQKNAMNEYAELCKNIKCGYEETDSYVYSLSDADKIEREVRALNKIGCSAEFTKNLPLPFSVKGAVRIKKQAQFNPLEFIYAIAKDLPIYENTKVWELTPDGAVTNCGKIKAKKIIVATHFPFINKHGSYFVKMYQHRSYVTALENAPGLHGFYVDESDTGMSFRNYNGLLLVGGGGHRTGKAGGGWSELEKFKNKYYPNANEVARWATQDCMTLDDIAYIGQYSKRTPNLYVATGFNKWGMSTSMVSAMILADLILERKNKYAEAFSPSRSILRKQLAINVGESLVGILTPTVPRCSHLGCALKYNKQEHSWDCSCHGSRFDERGNIINNPATRDKKM